MKHAFGFAILAGIALCPVPALANGEFVLTVEPDDGPTVEFSLADLDAMPQRSFRTETIWTDGVIEFRGVVLADLLEEAGAETGTLTLTALNDYAVEMPVAEIGDEYPIVATRMNGETMPVRDKGPYWLVYPYDENQRYRTETVYTRSIWQLIAISVME